MSKENPYRLDGKTILITGASSGIGKATAIECAKFGATLIISGRNEEKLKDTFKQLEGENHKMVVANLSSQDGIEYLVSNLSALDGAVLAAGIVKMCPVKLASRKKVEEIYNVNLLSPIETLRLIIKKKLYRKGFSGILLSSTDGVHAYGIYNGIYGSGKAALTSFSKYFALEYGGAGLRINTISPGLILTPMHTDGAVEMERLEEVAQKWVPLKRWGDPKEVAYAAIYLLSDAAGFITGSDIRIDGGSSIVHPQ